MIAARAGKKAGQKIKGTLGDRVYGIVVYALLILFALTIAVPLLYILSVSVSDEFAIMGGRVGIYPVGFSLKSYIQVLRTKSIMNAYGNTIVVAAGGAVFSVIMTSMAAYPLAYGNFPGKKAVAFLIMFTMWFSGGMIPSFIIMSRIGLSNTLWALIFASLMSAYNILILRTFFSSVPMALLESARIDGAHDFTMLFRIILPLSKAGLATIGLWVFISHWNDYMNPLIYIRDVSKYTLQPVLREMVLTSESSSMVELIEGNRTALPEQLKHAAIVCGMLPILIIYPFVQRYFVTGVMLGSVKG
jgi:putative aldouronate transport system permease protein